MSAPFLLEQSEVKPSLHMAIMNLPCKFEAAWQKPAPSDWVEGYVNGHRDTRYAAAELANEHHVIEQELLEALQRAAHALSKLSTIDCGCGPCTGSCRTGRGAEIELEGRMDYAGEKAHEARAAIRKATLGSEA